jgi:hypothetical protein
MKTAYPTNIKPLFLMTEDVHFALGFITKTGHKTAGRTDHIFRSLLPKNDQSKIL